MVNTSCFRICKIVLMISGGWPPTVCEKMSYRLLYAAYTVLFQTLTYLPFLYMEFLYLISTLGNIEKIIEGFALLVCHLIFIPKIIAVIVKQKEVKEILATLDSPSFNRTDKAKQEVINKAVKMVSMINYTFNTLVLVTGFLWAMVPLLKPVLVLPIRKPDMDTSTIWFKLLYIYQIFGVTFCGNQQSSIDVMIGGFMYLVAAELDLLHRELCNLGRKEFPDPDDFLPTNADIDIKEVSKEENGGVLIVDDHYDEAVHCVKFHQNLIELIERINTAFSVPVLIQFSGSTFLISIVVYRIMIVTDIMENLMMTAYLSGIIIQLLLYSYFGDILKQKSELIAKGAYFSNWQGMTPRVRKLVLLVIMRGQSPLVMTAGGIIEMNLNTFAAVIRTSYSYLALLNQRHATELSSN